MRVSILGESFLAQAMPFVAAARVLNWEGKPYAGLEVEASPKIEGAAGTFKSAKTDADGYVVFPMMFETVLKLRPIVPKGEVSNPRSINVTTIPVAEYSPEKLDPQFSYFMVAKGTEPLPWTTIGIVAGVLVLGYLLLKK